MKLILASGSPRRKEILSSLRVPFEIHLPRCREVHLSGDPVGTVFTNAQAKCRDVAARYPDAAVIAADTVVSFHGHVLGKPASPEEAAAWLNAYAGETQVVYTAVSMTVPHQKSPSTYVEATSLQFINYNENVVAEYLQRVRPFDRAGAYDINCLGELLIQKRYGSYSNVMGLPRDLVHMWLAHAMPEAFHI